LAARLVVIGLALVTTLSLTDRSRKSMKVRIAQHIGFVLMTMMLAACSKTAPIITSAKDAETSRIGVMTGSTSEAIAAKRFPLADVKHFDDVVDAIGALKAGQLDAVLTGYPAALQSTKRNHDLALVQEDLSNEDTSIGIKKGNTKLLSQVDGIISKLKADGTLADMSRRWFKKDLSPYEEIDITLPTKGAPLKVGVSATREPFNFVDAEGRITGHDGELSRRIAQGLDRPVEFENMRFASLIPALQAGKIDIIITGMSATPERAKKIDFTQRYYELHQVLLVRSALAINPNGPSFWDRTVESFDSNIIKEKRYLLLLEGLKTTVLISILSAALGTLLGALVCYMRMSGSSYLNMPARVFIDILRGTPVLVLLMLIFYVVFASLNVSPVMVSVVAFGLNFGAYSAEIFRTGIEGVDRGQTEAGVSMGFTRAQTFFNIVLPQMIQRVLPIYKGEFISLVKMTSVVGYIAVHDLTKASDIIRSRTFDAFFPLVMVAVLYFFVSWIFIRLLGLIERKTDPRRRRHLEAKS
jgi:polar amino acid transport system substrate-binding protein